MRPPAPPEFPAPFAWYGDCARDGMAPNSVDGPDLDIPDSPLADPVQWVPTPPDAPLPLPKPGTLTATEKRVAAASIVGGALVTLVILMARTGASAADPAHPS